ncbi:LytTR family transcriptional regulator [Spirosoma sp. HMF4905]|uniref:LytTR family transcriptional regulator n=1 Tax=Spirosoma arboris TaxID=2682092 RepID=A0A7K1S4D7_9BACT|nr:LytTR family transcriptional regulator DNA-binding domain-containing protein [Spirosoma arboris]MVM28692.1 LytTR family transcriptional regulator [Spirosoma arboris]
MSVIKPALQQPELIAYFSGANNYCWLYFRNGEKKLLAKPISYLESQLPDFIRVHKTILINPAYIKSLDEPPHKKMAGKVHLDSGEVFPVSRRRWLQVVESLQNRSAGGSRVEKVNSSPEPYELPLTAQAYDSAGTSLFLITNDKEKAAQAELLIRDKWPTYPIHIGQNSAPLIELLKQLPEHEYPLLILLDARTQTAERLNTLQRLKEDSELSRIPVVLLVLPTEQLVINGYQRQANSVVSMPIGSPLFGHTIERICQFWLHIVSLPGSGRATK